MCATRAHCNLTFCALTCHCRRCRDEAWPFHETVNELVAWLVRQARGFDAALRIAPTPRPFPAAPRLAITDRRTRAATVTERVSWMDEEATGGTPGQGVARDPKHKTDAHQEDQLRLDNCPGFIFVKVEKRAIDHPDGRKEIKHVDKRGKCSICSTNAKFCCALCKQRCCVVDRLDEVAALVDDDSGIVDFLEGEQPCQLLTTKTSNPKKQVVEEHFFRNSCCHIRHRKGLEKAMKSRNEGDVVDSEQGGH